MTNAGRYTVTSAKLGTASSIVITNAPLNNICEELKLGQCGGVEAAGQGNVADLSAVTIAEILTQIPTYLTGVTAANVNGALKLTSDTTGIGSSLAIKAGSLNAALGFTDNSTTVGKPLIDITGITGTTFKLKMSATDEAEDVTIDPTGLDTGAKIATALQNAIQALTGEKTGATVAYSALNGGSYTITSAKLGTSSNPVVTNGAEANLADDLCLGVANGGTETAGTGDCADIAAVTPAELAAVINSDIAGCSAVAGADSVTVTSDTDGNGSSVVVSDGTLNTALGVTENDAATGAVGLGYETDMLDALYDVTITQCLDGSETIATDTYAVDGDTKATDGFDIQCSTATSTNHVNMTIISRSPLFDS